VTEIRIMFSRYSAFYSPLIATRAAGFLSDEGLAATFSIASPGEVPRARLSDGSVHLIQSAPGASFAPLERGETSEIVHFAQINQRDGFLLAARAPDPAFRWDKLAGARVLVDHGAQPLAMFKFALHRQGVEFGKLVAIDAGTSEQMVSAFRAGEADYVHLQGPAPQQLEKDGAGHVVASVGEAFGPVAFSSLCATRGWLASDMAQAFMRAYRKAQAWVLDAPADEVARVEGPYFEGIDADVLERTIAFYQQLGNWSRTPEIPRDAYEVTLDVFAHSGLITRRHPYDAVVVPPPGS
jgi:NitT/TauT family transport system substrate-binding protein